MRNNFWRINQRHKQKNLDNKKISDKDKKVLNAHSGAWTHNLKVMSLTLYQLCGYTSKLGSIDLGAELSGTSAPRRRGWDSAARTSAP
jgi:hypothetical protein